MRNLLFPAVLAIAFTTQSSVLANPALMKTNCANCHNDKKAKGKFNLRLLGDDPTTENVKLWEESLENVRAGDMPPEDESKLSKADRQRLVQFLGEKIQAYHKVAGVSTVLAPRRLNNRELANSVARCPADRRRGHASTDREFGRRLAESRLRHGWRCAGDQSVSDGSVYRGVPQNRRCHDFLHAPAPERSPRGQARQHHPGDDIANEGQAEKEAGKR